MSVETLKILFTIEPTTVLKTEIFSLQLDVPFFFSDDFVEISVRFIQRELKIICRNKYKIQNEIKKKLL